MSRQLWNVRCGAHRTNGQPCGAWAIRGGYVCRSHGGATRQARASAEARMVLDRMTRRFARLLAAEFRRQDALTPAQRQAEGAAYLRDLASGRAS